MPKNIVVTTQTEATAPVVPPTTPEELQKKIDDYNKANPPAPRVIVDEAKQV